MTEFQQSVIDEKQRLDERRQGLNDAIDSQWFHDQTTDEQSRLQSQQDYMTGYSAILGARIAAFS